MARKSTVTTRTEEYLVFEEKGCDDSIPEFVYEYAASDFTRQKEHPTFVPRCRKFKNPRIVKKQQRDREEWAQERKIEHNILMLGQLMGHKSPSTPRPPPPSAQPAIASKKAAPVQQTTRKTLAVSSVSAETAHARPSTYHDQAHITHQPSISDQPRNHHYSQYLNNASYIPNPTNLPQFYDTQHTYNTHRPQASPQYSNVPPAAYQYLHAASSQRYQSRTVSQASACHPALPRTVPHTVTRPLPHQSISNNIQRPALQYVPPQGLQQRPTSQLRVASDNNTRPTNASPASAVEYSPGRPQVVPYNTYAGLPFQHRYNPSQPKQQQSPQRRVTQNTTFQSRPLFNYQLAAGSQPHPSFSNGPKYSPQLSNGLYSLKTTAHSVSPPQRNVAHPSMNAALPAGSLLHQLAPLSRPISGQRTFKPSQKRPHEGEDITSAYQVGREQATLSGSPPVKRQRLMPSTPAKSTLPKNNTIRPTSRCADTARPTTQIPTTPTSTNGVNPSPLVHPRARELASYTDIPNEIKIVVWTVWNMPRAGRTNLPFRHELKTRSDLALYFDRAAGIIRRDSLLYRYYGDTRLFTDAEWKFLTGGTPP